MVGDDDETAAGVMLPVPARAASHAGGVEEANQFDEVAPHADGGEVAVHANDGVEAPVLSDAAMPDAGGDAEVPPNADEVEGVQAGVEIPKWRCKTCELHKPQSDYPNNRGINCNSCKNGWAAVWRTAKRTGPQIQSWLLYFKRNVPSSARSMYYACRLHDGYEARAQVMAQYVALHPMPPPAVKAPAGMMLAANAPPAAKAKVCDCPLPAVPVAPAAPQFQPHLAGEHQLVRRRDGDRYQVIDVCIFASEHGCVVVVCVCVALRCSPLLLILRDQLLMLKCGSLVRARRHRVKAFHILYGTVQLASLKL
jgi:hypothetical protein